MSSSMSLLEVGDRVRLSRAGESVFENSYFNPHSTVGTIRRFTKGYFAVDWDLRENFYTPIELELVL